MAKLRDYYDILGVSRAADVAEIKRAYRRLAMRLHPDHNPKNQQAAERFREICEAYDILSDPQRKSYFDRFGKICGSEMDGLFQEAGHLFRDLFSCSAHGDGVDPGDRGRAERRGQGGPDGPARRPGDCRITVALSFAEAVCGVAKEIELTRNAPCESCDRTGMRPGAAPQPCARCAGRGEVMASQGCLKIAIACAGCRGRGVVTHEPCAECHGSGTRERREIVTLNIPRGVDDGQVLRVLGKGQSPSGGPPGNLYVAIQVRPDERFRRRDLDVFTEVKVPFVVAALGGTIRVPTLEQGCTGSAEIVVPKGAQQGEVIVRSGAGITRCGRDQAGRPEPERGDQIVELRIEVPRSLSERQKQLLEEFAQESARGVSPIADAVTDTPRSAG